MRVLDYKKWEKGEKLSKSGDITFYKKFNNRADYEFNIENIKLEEIPKMLIEFLELRNEEFKRYMEQKMTASL